MTRDPKLTMEEAGNIITKLAIDIGDFVEAKQPCPELGADGLIATSFNLYMGNGYSFEESSRRLVRRIRQFHEDFRLGGPIQ